MKLVKRVRYRATEGAKDLLERLRVSPAYVNLPLILCYSL